MLEKGRECIASMIQRIEGQEREGKNTAQSSCHVSMGLAIQKIIDPAFDIDRAYKTLQKLFRTLLE